LIRQIQSDVQNKLLFSNIRNLRLDLYLIFQLSLKNIKDFSDGNILILGGLYSYFEDLNINQNNFDKINNASSIKNITGIDYDLNHLTTRLINFFEDLDTRFNQNSIDDIKSEYVNNLYGNNSVIKFASDQKELHGKIIDVISENKIKLLVNDKEIVFSSGDLKLIF